MKNYDRFESPALEFIVKKGFLREYSAWLNSSRCKIKQEQKQVSISDRISFLEKDHSFLKWIVIFVLYVFLGLMFLIMMLGVI